MTLRIAFLVFDGVRALDVSGPCEVFHPAEQFGRPYDRCWSPPGAVP
ncbi:hypothetical protein [Streptomyces paromomycinus]|uniref:AraC family transcriptional regulator n=1 Tax=Streptomyces paromomycinus TaxID=92743 RepID=A0A401W4B8_STREY|nr:hypothetical protein [Streptomyces paromomycinus]GCD44174.1 AraC family transcriptional regulator [Streptomyces paromomycinus]